MVPSVTLQSIATKTESCLSSCALNTCSVAGFEEKCKRFYRSNTSIQNKNCKHFSNQYGKCEGWEGKI